MQYRHIERATFLHRPNRFLAQVLLKGAEVTVHVKNTGRCKELLVPGCVVYLNEPGTPNRKTRYDLVAVEKETPQGILLVNMDAQAPNQVFGEWVAAGGFGEDVTLIQPEKTYGKSRFDFYLESGRGQHFVEVKGCTLEEDGLCRFPDAPTLRGTKHLNELAACVDAGFDATVCFVIQMEGMKAFYPNDMTDPAFGTALRRANARGVHVLARGCRVTESSLELGEEIPVIL